MRTSDTRAGARATLLTGGALAALFLCRGFALAAPAANAVPAAKAHSALAALALFAQTVQDKGHDAQLPPHLSKELALNDGARPTPVRQIATRVDTVVHAFNVLAGPRRQRVLFTYDEAAHLTQAYTLRTDGALGRAVSYRSGEAGMTMPLAAASAGYQREVKFWSEYVHGKPPVTPTQGLRPAAPLPAQPAPDAATTHQ
jgi:hypothetical protein